MLNSQYTSTLKVYLKDSCSFEQRLPVLPASTIGSNDIEKQIVLELPR